MLHNGSKFHMKMCREPVAGLEVGQELLSSRTSQSVGLHFLTQKLLLPQQFPRTSIVVDPTRPVVAHENVYGHLDLSGNKHLRMNIHCLDKSFELYAGEQVEYDIYLFQFEHLNITDVVNTSKCIRIVWREFMVTLKSTHFL